MRKDSELFLRKCLQYKDETGKKLFELDITCFPEIPNVEVEIEDIFDELKSKKCISKKSEILGQTIRVYLTLDGITYFKNENTRKKQGDTFIFSGKQINIATDNGKVDAKQYENVTEDSPKTIVIEDNKNTSPVAPANSGNELLWLFIIGLFVLTDIYLDYRFQVQMGLAIASIVIEVITHLVYYNSKKTQLIYGKNIKEMLYFNMFSILCILLLIGVINSPIYTSKINLDSFNQSIDNEGIGVDFFNFQCTNYALFQVVGMLFLALLLFRIICSNIYIIAVTNISTGRRGRWFWNSLFKLTYKRGIKWKRQVAADVFILVTSVLSVAGIIPYIINVLYRM